MSSESNVTPAGAGLSDAEMVQQVAGQTSSDLEAEEAFEGEAEGASDDEEASKSTALQDEVAATQTAEQNPG